MPWHCHDTSQYFIFHSRVLDSKELPGVMLRLSLHWGKRASCGPATTWTPVMTWTQTSALCLGGQWGWQGHGCHCPFSHGLSDLELKNHNWCALPVETHGACKRQILILKVLVGPCSPRVPSAQVSKSPEPLNSGAEGREECAGPGQGMFPILRSLAVP